jgi:hypothetical protein
VHFLIIAGGEGGVRQALTRERLALYPALITGGIFQAPLPGGRIEGDDFVGQYILNIMMNSPFGAGSQFASLRGRIGRNCTGICSAPIALMARNLLFL